MAQVCDNCSRGTTKGFNVSHSKVRTKKFQRVNLQSKKVDNQRLKLCTSCIKTLNKKTA
ncbi:MAG: 50S ribosomal protein L28 [Candidatus Buchananbacteria bacterium]|nr:50S ribosomal protein L28 [Candidatus Buchananbacteria bacterium]